MNQNQDNGSAILTDIEGIGWTFEKNCQNGFQFAELSLGYYAIFVAQPMSGQ